MFSFYKMQVNGNDYVIVNFLEKKLEYSFKLLSKFLCDRRFGVGCDSTLIIEPSDFADFKVKIFNKYGDEETSTSNGILCATKYLYENNLTDKNELKIETKLGVRDVIINMENNCVSEIEVDMGEAEFNISNMPIIYSANNPQVVFDIEDLKIYPVLIEELYVVCFVDDIYKIDVKKYGKLIENYRYFPNKTNVEFVQIIDTKNIKIKSWKKDRGEIFSGRNRCLRSCYCI